jgi:hypothetical protein
MATIIQIKRSTGTTAPNTLSDGELAYTHGAGTQADNGDRLFIGDGSSVNVIGGEYFVNLMDHVHGTLTASSALLVDSNSAIDDFYVGNHSTTGGSLKLNEGTTNGTNYIALKSPNALSANTIYTLPATPTAGNYLTTNSSGDLSWGSITSSFDIAADSGTTDSFNTGETLTFAGGTGVDTTVTNNQISIAIDSTVATLDDTQTLTNKTLTSPDINTATIEGGTIGDATPVTVIKVDNISLDANTISTTNANGDLVLSPNGTATVIVPSGYENRAGFTDQSLVPKSYVDAIAEGLHVHASVKAATTQNLATESGDTVTYNNGTSGVGATLTLSTGISTLDGYTLVNGDRILIKNETNQAHNGIYTRTSSTVFTRATDFDTVAEVASGDFLFVEEGTVNEANGFVQTETTTAIGTSNIIFEQFSGAGQITAGNGLTKNGNTIDAVGTADKITVSANAITIASTYVGQTSITTLGTIATGTWNGDTIAYNYGGTGQTSYAQGDIVYASAANTLAKLALGANGKILQSDGTDILYGDIDGGTF